MNYQCPTRNKLHWADLFTGVGAGAVFAVGLITACGWLLGSATLLRLRDGLPAIAADTTILFCLSGIGLAGIAARKHFLPSITGTVILAAALGGLTIGPNRGVLYSVHRFFPHWTETVLSIGNISIMSMVRPVAVIFVLSGCALIFAGLEQKIRQALWTVGGIGAVLSSIGCFGLIALAAKLDSGIRYFLGQMSVWTALGALVMGVSFCAVFLGRSHHARRHPSMTLVIVTLVVLFLLSWCMNDAVLVNTDAMLASRSGSASANNQTAMIHGLIEDVQASETGQRGFLLTNNGAYLDGYEASKHAVDKKLQELADRLGPSNEWENLAAATRAKMEELARTVALEEDGHHAQALSVVRTNLGFYLSQRIRKSAEKMMDPLRITADQSAETNRRSAAAVKASVLWSAVLSLLLIVSVIALVATEVRGWDAEQQHLQQNAITLAGHRERADEANRAKSAFLATMSHEIRTPMNAILGMADLLSATALNEQQAKYVDVFQRASSNLLHLINNILDLSKIESGKLHLETIPFDLHDTIARTLELIRLKTDAKGVMLTALIAPDVPIMIAGDSMRLQQVLLNLLGNADKFTSQGSVELTVGLQANRTAADLQFEITDTGIGIPPDKLKSIFEDFTQVDASTTRQYGGTGLGLGIVKHLVELMHGEIRVESQVGRGSTFRFTACFQPAQAVKVHCNGALPANLNGKRVLVMDDDDTNRLILRETLEKEGLAISDFSDLQAALRLLERETRLGRTFSLLLLESRMAGSDGFEAFTQLRLVDPAVPAVILTSDDRPGEAARCWELGISDYVVKPVQRSALLQIVAKAIGNQTSPIPESLDKVEAQAGLRILIAEDSEDNRFLMQQYLAGTAHRIVFAENGEKAVRLYEERDFDLILMDMQMPVMDGCAATRAIRAFDRHRGQTDIPIWALTANALDTDRKASEEAGCNGHLTKPISKQRLFSALEIHRAEGGFGTRKLLIKMPEGLEGLAPKYLTNRKEDARALGNLLAASEFTSIQRIGHDMKGTGASYGFDRLTELGSDLEQSAKTGDLEQLERIVAELGSYLNRVRLS